MSLSALRILFISLLAIVSSLARANGPEQSNGFQRICSAQTPPVEPGSAPVNPGLLWNPQRLGTGWTLAYSPISGPQSGQSGSGLGVHLIWYTYRSDGSPVWYLSEPTTIVASTQDRPSFETSLFEYRWNPTAAAGLRASQRWPAIGRVKGYFSSQDQSRLAIEWTLDGGASFHPECLIDFSREFHPNPGAAVRGPDHQVMGVNLAFNGAYYNPLNSGWGMLQHVVRTNGVADESLFRSGVRGQV
jgi:hypothetical protein